MLDYSTFFEDCDAKTLREYFQALLSTLWDEGEGFSGKRPFGNSCWENEFGLSCGSTICINLSKGEK